MGDGPSEASTAASDENEPAAHEPEPDRIHRVAGLSSPVELIEDRFGVAHLYAHSQDDVFLAQGFNAARERLFQIDLWRRRGLGQLAEVLGPEYVEQDRATRLFLYRGDMAAEWARYGADAQRIASNFVAGINAYVAWLEENPDRLPEEFTVLGYRPSRWRPEDVVRIRSHGLTRNARSEVERAFVAHAAGLRADAIRKGLQPPWTTVVPEGFDPGTLPRDVLTTFELAMQPVEFREGAVRAVSRPDAVREGSNSWAVSPGRSATGRPILASDPHREYSAPPARYLAHLSAPGLDVIGAGEPMLPGVSIGHNGTIAFGLTIFAIDQEDLYVYELDPDDHSRYRFGDGWEELTVLHEQVPVRGEADRTVELPFTRHGPVIHVDQQHHRAYALRTVWLEPGTAPYFGAIGYLRASCYADFAEATRNWGAPAENQVYADVHGTIAWNAGGLAPKRAGYDGLLPVPGDGRYDWDGFLPGEELPSTINPAAGFVATANEFNLPDGHPAVGFEWEYPFRHDRIVEALSAQPRHSLADSARLQNDQVSLLGRRLITLLSNMDSVDPVLRRALHLLRGWDADESADSAPAALFEVWMLGHLGPLFVRTAVPDAAEVVPGPDNLVMLDELERPGAWLPDETVRDRVLLDSLRSAYVQVCELLGTDEAAWRWGDLHYAHFPHPAAAVLPSPERFDVGPVRCGGSLETVNQAAYYPGEFRSVNGPSVRLVLDVGDWDASLAVNVPGQSGDPSSAHYRDLVEPWRAGDYFPLAYSRAAVERLAERRTMLVPD